MVIQYYEEAREIEHTTDWHDQLEEHEANLNGEQLANLNGRYTGV